MPENSLPMEGLFLDSVEMRERIVRYYGVVSGVRGVISTMREPPNLLDQSVNLPEFDLI